MRLLHARSFKICYICIGECDFATRTRWRSFSKCARAPGCMVSSSIKPDSSIQPHSYDFSYSPWLCLCANWRAYCRGHTRRHITHSHSYITIVHGITHVKCTHITVACKLNRNAMCPHRLVGVGGLQCAGLHSRLCWTFSDVGLTMFIGAQDFVPTFSDNNPHINTLKYGIVSGLGWIAERHHSSKSKLFVQYTSTGLLS